MTDFFDSGPAIAAVSFESAGINVTLKGIQTQPHETSQQTDIETGDPLWFDAEKTQPRMQAVITLATDYRNFEFCSESFKERATKDGAEDDGLRKLYVRGTLKAPSLNKTLRDAMREVGAKSPEVGSVHEVTLVKRSPIQGSKYKRNDFAYVYTPPTAETLAKVEQHAKEPALVGGPAAEDHDDSEPPF